MEKLSKVGRKKIEDKKEMVGIYLRPSELKKLGGKDSFRQQLVLYAETMVKLKKEDNDGVLL
jgi:hypothetical protein